jgi:hypothetical protein
VGRRGLSRLTGYPEVILVCPQSHDFGKFASKLPITPFLQELLFLLWLSPLISVAVCKQQITKLLAQESPPGGGGPLCQLICF